MSDSKTRVLYLDLLSGLWPHSLQQLKAVAQLPSEDFHITHISCGSYMKNFCIVMESRNRELSKGKILKSFDCSSCRFAANTISQKINQLNLKTEDLVKLNSFVTQKVHDEVQAIIDANSALELNLNFEIEEIPIVRISLYETLLKFKKKDYSLNSHEHAYFIESLRAATYSTLLMSEFMKTNPRFDLAISHSAQYSPNNAIAHILRKYGVETYLVDGSGNISERYSAVQIYNWNQHGLIRPAIKYWDEQLKFLRLETEDLTRLNEHRKQLELGRSFDVYSESTNPDFNVREFFNIPKKNKIMLLALSSVDEVFAAQTIGATPVSKYPGTVFLDQYEWVTDTVKWASKKADISLIIRMHPRDLPNKRESIKSEQASIWESMEEDLPKNVRLNHPEDKISIQDLIPTTDVFITGWSTTALIAAEEGVPTVSYDSNVSGFPPSIHLTGTTKAEYFQTLDKLSVSETVKIKNAGNVALWKKFNLLSGTVQLTPRLGEKLRLTGPAILGKLLTGAEIYLYWIWMPFETFFGVKKLAGTGKIPELLATKSGSLYELEHIDS